MAKGHAFVPPVPYRGKLSLPMIYEMRFNEGLFRPRPSIEPDGSLASFLYKFASMSLVQVHALSVSGI
jgi:hypothetical protein